MWCTDTITNNNKDHDQQTSTENLNSLVRKDCISHQGEKNPTKFSYSRITPNKTGVVIDFGLTNPDHNHQISRINTKQQQESSSSLSEAGLTNSCQNQPAPGSTIGTTTMSTSMQQQRGSIATTIDRPEKISFHLKTSIFVRRVTIDTDKMALGSIKQLAIAFLNELYFQHSYPSNTYIGDYIRKHYSNTDNLNQLYDRLILRKYNCDQECFVPFNSVCDIEPESYISVEVAERHLLNMRKINSNLANDQTFISITTSPTSSATTATTTPSTSTSPQPQSQPMITPTNLSATKNFNSINTYTNHLNSPTSTSTSSSSSLSVNYFNSTTSTNVTTINSAATTATTSSSSSISQHTNLIRMTHEFKPETFLFPTYCASCSALLKGVFRQGYQCSFCKKNYCLKCKTRAEQSDSSDSCLASVVANNLTGHKLDSSNLTSASSNYTSSSSNPNTDSNMNQLSSCQNQITGANIQSSSTCNASSNKLDVANQHMNMSKRKSASNLLQHFNIANPFKIHHNQQQHQQQQQQQQTSAIQIKDDKSKSRSSAGALEPVLNQLNKQREQQQSQHQQQYFPQEQDQSNQPTVGMTGNTLLVNQTAHLSSSHQNLYMNDSDNRNRNETRTDDELDTRSNTTLHKLSNSARTSKTDLHHASTSPTKRDQTNHNFIGIDSGNNQLAATNELDNRCDVCKKSLKSQQQGLICKNCQLQVHNQCQNLILTDCMSRIAESSRAAAELSSSSLERKDQQLDSNMSPQESSDDRTAVKSSNSNISRDNIRLHRLAPSVKHVKRPDSTKPIIEGWLKHTTLSDEQARKHYWRLDENDITLYENDTSTRYFKSLALNKITRVMSSHSLPKQIREDVLLSNALVSSKVQPQAQAQAQAQAQVQVIGNVNDGGVKIRSANASPIKSPELQAQMKAIFAFEFETGSMYLVQAPNESEALKWRESLAKATGKSDQPIDIGARTTGTCPPQLNKTAATTTTIKKNDIPSTVNKLVESVSRINLQPSKQVDPTEGTAVEKQEADSKDKIGATQDKQPKQPTIQRQHHHRYPPKHRINFTDPNRSRLYNRPRKTIQLDGMEVPDHWIAGKYLIERDRSKGVGFEELGSGQFGKVYAAISEIKCDDTAKGLWSGVPVAIKEISKARFDLRQQAKLKNEANILSGLDHPGVIILERVHDLPDKIYIVMEQLEDDMLEMIVSTEEKRLNERITKFLTYQILEALKYLHAQKIAHCDLKPENVLLVERKHTFPQIKLCDFGFAKIIEENSFRSSLVGTPAYLAPEVVKGERYNRSVDLWSVGVIVYVSLSGEFPFNEGENIHDQISRANFMYPDQPWAKISQQAKNFINSLLRVNCEKRLSASTAQMDVWIQDYQLWCDLCDLELRVGKRWVTDDADFDRWSRYAREHGLRVPNSAIQLHESLTAD